MHIGYARTSTADQLAGFESQIKELEKPDVKKYFLNKFHLLLFDLNFNQQLNLSDKAID